MEPNSASIVIDNGSGMLKAGFAGESEPRVILPSLIGHPKYNRVYTDRGSKELYIGQSALTHRGVLNLKYPVEHGIVTDWDDMTRVWQHTFQRELYVDPQQHAVMLTDAPLNPRTNRERMAEVMFEHFHVPALYVGTQAVLPLYAASLETGLVVDMGDGVTHAVPVCDGYIISNGITRIDLAGRDLTNFLVRLLKERGYSFTTSAEWETVRQVKEEACYVSQSFEEELQAAASTPVRDYTLSDGCTITLREEQFCCPEALFQPDLLGMECPGIAETTFKSIMSTEIDLRRQLFSRIMLTGGTSMLPGLQERMKTELEELIKARTSIRSSQVEITALPDRKHAVWMGGSVLAQMDGFRSKWVTKQQYEDHGPRIVHKKCL